MSSPKHPPSIPPEALARRASLQAVLRAMEGRGASLEPSPMHTLRRVVSGEATADAEVLLAALVQDHLEEEAGELLRTSRREAVDQAVVQALASRLAPLARMAQQRREAHWHLDTRRQLVRFSYSKEGEVTGLDDGDLHAIFLLAFRLEGLALVLDLAKRPRLLLGAGLPLPAGVGGLAETLDAVLKKEPAEDPPALLARLNRRLPAGLRVHRWEVLPAYASPVSELVLRSHWRWRIPPELKEQVETKVLSFLDASLWPWHREPSKAGAPLDLRGLIPEMQREQDTLAFTSRMGAFQAINPLKMLGAILDLDPAGLLGLVRTQVDLKPDVRLGQAERFEPKLKNMYEDAVLLGGASNIVLVDEDDEDPIQLG